MARTKNFAEVIRKKLAADPDLADAVEVESFHADIAMKVYEARTAARLTKKQLAERAGTQQSVISRIEDADYDGYSLGSLKKIANALEMRLRTQDTMRSMPRVETITCDTCGRDLAQTGQDWRIVVKSECITSPYPTPPQIKEPKYFCSLRCLGEWAEGNCF